MGTKNKSTIEETPIHEVLQENRFKLEKVKTEINTIREV